MEELKKAKKCEDCNGVGAVSTMESVYPGTPDAGIQAPIGSETCENCAGTGEEQDEEIVKERIVDNLSAEQEKKLQDEFSKIETGVLDDDLPDAFESWLVDLSLEEITNILK